MSHLLFVDDCYFFFRVTKTEKHIMKSILNRYERYERIPGRAVNYIKSNIMFSLHKSHR